MIWDIFCKVIDNYGDIGVCWRLACDLASRGEQVRLWVDDVSALAWMAPEGNSSVEVHLWKTPLEMDQIAVGDVLIEAFGCDISPEYIAEYVNAKRAKGKTNRWINLEYLSAEKYAKNSHGLPSPVMSGPGAGLTKYFFYPGFTAGTGGLLSEDDLLQRQAIFDRDKWLSQFGIQLNTSTNERLVSLFCYEPPALTELLDLLAADPMPTRLLVTAGRASRAVSALLDEKKAGQPSWNINSTLSISYLPFLSQNQYDELLWACDLNFVRGEDSLVRAIWAGKPFVWHIYPQSDDAHHAKLDAFLSMLGADATLRRLHERWNGLTTAPLPSLALADWQKTVSSARTRLLAQDSLTSLLLQFASKKR